MVYTMDIQDLKDIVDIPTFVATLQQENITQIFVAVGGYTSTGIYMEAGVDFAAFISAVKTLAPSMTFIASCYGDINNQPNWQAQGITTTLMAQVQAILALGFDVYEDDNELIGDDYTKAPLLVMWWHNQSDACHAVGKKSAVYYGIDLSNAYDPAKQVLPTFTDQDFIEARFLPIGANAVQALEEVMSLCPVPWKAQLRAASSNPDGENFANALAFFTAQTSLGNFLGYDLWAWEYITAADWTQFNNALGIQILVPQPSEPQPTTPTTTTTSNKSLAARVPSVGNGALVQVYLRRLRDRFISKELHKKIHPLV